MANEWPQKRWNYPRGRELTDQSDTNTNEESTTAEEPTTTQTVEASPTDSQSALFVGRWRGLVSTTNWEKGKVISEWRQSLVEAKADSSEYSDEAWSRRVGRVTPQHVGRLRRVFEVYGESRTDFEGLFWSHFHATIDWEDAEMWLEGAVQNHWSVSQMRRQRWETLGGDEATEPQDGDIVSTEKDEDIDFDESAPLAGTVDASVEKVEGYNKEERPEGSDDDEDDSDDDVATMELSAEDSAAEELPPVRPFSDLPELPDDLADAFDDMKLAILRHKVNQWEEIPLDDVVKALDALKSLAAAPSGDMV